MSIETEKKSTKEKFSSFMHSTRRFGQKGCQRHQNRRNEHG